MMNISVIGAGYVGLANAILLSQAHPTLLFDIDTQRIQRLMQGRSPIKDPLIESYLTNSSLQLRFSDDENEAYQASDLILIATPTNYDPYRDAFDTKSVEEAIHKACAHNPQATIVIKSTIPIGFSERMQAQYPHACILFSPEFLREGQALHDNLHPSRIIVGAVKEALLPKAQMVAHLLQEGALEDAPIIVTGANDAECIKLFANAYLAMRVSFFNELDSFAATHQLNTRAIIEGIGLDPRIGMHYNNPSFGFGGYCLPKDSMQLRQQFQQANIPCALIPAIVESNQKRKNFIINHIVNSNVRTVGIYRLTMKKDSDNFRESAIIDIIRALPHYGIEVIIYEPMYHASQFDGFAIIHDLQAFKTQSEMILSNRLHPDLATVQEKVYTRDIFNND